MHLFFLCYNGSLTASTLVLKLCKNENTRKVHMTAFDSRNRENIVLLEEVVCLWDCATRQQCSKLNTVYRLSVSADNVQRLMLRNTFSFLVTYTYLDFGLQISCRLCVGNEDGQDC